MDVDWVAPRATPYPSLPFNYDDVAVPHPITPRLPTTPIQQREARSAILLARPYYQSDGAIDCERGSKPDRDTNRWSQQRTRMMALEDGELEDEDRERLRGHGTTYQIGNGRLYVPASVQPGGRRLEGRGRAPSSYVPPPTTRAAAHLTHGGRSMVRDESAGTWDAPRREQSETQEQSPIGTPRPTALRAHRMRDTARGTDQSTLYARASYEDDRSQNRHAEGGYQPSHSLRTEAMDDEDGGVPRALRGRDQRAHTDGTSVVEEDGGRSSTEMNSDSESEEEDQDDLPTCLRGTVNGEEDRPMPISPFDTVPRVYKDQPEMYLRGISTKWLDSMWSMRKGISMLTVVFNYEYTDNDVYNRLVANSLKMAAMKISGDKGIKAVPQEPKYEGMRKRDAPFLWGLRGFSEEGARRMSEAPVWSFQAITFFIIEKEVRPDSWAFSLVGFLDDDAEEIALAVRSVLSEDENLMEIARLTKRNPDFRGMREDQRIKTILGSIRVDTWTLSNNNTVANVYIRPPTRVIAKWHGWMEGLRALRYSNYVNGTGRVRHITHCEGCRGANHPTHLCPFPRMVGWNGPEAGTHTFTRLPLPDLTPKARQPPRSARNAERSWTGEMRGGMTRAKKGAKANAKEPSGSRSSRTYTPRQDGRRR
ncbi:hypothetical protein C8T65DRAFT_747531 [Cerioporus squamosus]|nr:hypothetical protein C8T65DRAFT_747531 [Cerioporus squamosus]